MYKDIVLISEESYDIEILLEDVEEENSEKEKEGEVIDLNLSSTNISDKNDQSDEDEDLDKLIIHLPEKYHHNRNPGSYEDINSKYKKKHNNLILKAALNLKERIVGLVLDGKKMRTTRTLYKAGDKIKRINVIEINCMTFDIMKKRILKQGFDHNKVQIFNAHIMDYISRGIDPKVNVVYLDVMCNFFDSHKTKGTQSIIDEVLDQLTRSKIVFAATFCLRQNFCNISYKEQISQILIKLSKIFKEHYFTHTPLIKRKEMRYKGQRELNGGMMFVIYLLEKNYY